ncbi:hypothetical protein FA95DRAFT_1564762 [Auriscalpium vulgare]|uniref:Uncharacterized protein n=1 Tax=Auriscalpium vulgare TaxID=40419 RepID=A0ACB8RCW7_9AGAM|nr:hypothetical protein FA95DRAFT_1564762 [Auriscalpium vulgare]
MFPGRSFCWDSDTFRAAVPASLPFDPKSDNPIASDLVKFLAENADTPGAQALLSCALTARDSTADFDFRTLKSTIRHHHDAAMLTMLFHGASVDVPGKRFTVLEALDNPWAPAKYKMYVYGDGPPTGAAILEFVRRAMTKPPAPHTPMIPTVMAFMPEFAPYHAALAPFLRSLPAPFMFKMASPHPAAPANPAAAPIPFEEPKDELDEDAKEPLSFEATLQRADAAKQRGNGAFAAFQSGRALAAYARALQWLARAHHRAPRFAEEERVYALVAVVTANRAAVHLRNSGAPERYLREALRDGEIAEQMDPAYAKGYYRQARAWVLLGDVEKARDVLERGLDNVAPWDMQQIRDALAELPRVPNQSVPRSACSSAPLGGVSYSDTSSGSACVCRIQYTSSAPMSMSIHSSWPWRAVNPSTFNTQYLVKSGALTAMQLSCGSKTCAHGKFTAQCWGPPTSVSETTSVAILSVTLPTKCSQNLL